MGIQDREYFRRWQRGDSKPKHRATPPNPPKRYRPRAAPDRTPSTPGYLVREQQQQRQRRRRRIKLVLLFGVLLAIAVGVWALINYGVWDDLRGLFDDNEIQETDSVGTSAAATDGDSSPPNGTANASPSSSSEAGSTTGNGTAAASPSDSAASAVPSAECPDSAEVAASADSPATVRPASGIDGEEMSSLQQLVLDLTNNARRLAGLRPVRLGANLAPQEHAEDMAEHCFLSHWGTNGMKPYMRYSLAGGVQANAENVSGWSFCPADPSRYPQRSLAEKAQEAFEGLMNSPGHRDNILRPAHRVLHLGMAYRAPNFWLAQQFSGHYATFAQLPEIENGQLSFDMTACNGAQVSGDDLGVQVRYDPLPTPLTPGQLQRTSCYSSGEALAQLRRPIRWPKSWFVSYDERDWFMQTGSECLDPRTLSRVLPPAQSYEEAAALETFESRALLSLPEIITWITADQWDVDDGQVRITADLSTLSRFEDKGVYTIMIWGSVDGESVPIAEYSIISD